MKLTASQHNDSADELFAKAEFSRALACYQQVFLDCGKSPETALLAQVARALCGAARCYEQFKKTEMTA